MGSNKYFNEIQNYSYSENGEHFEKCYLFSFFACFVFCFGKCYNRKPCMQSLMIASANGQMCMRYCVENLTGVYNVNIRELDESI